MMLLFFIFGLTFAQSPSNPQVTTLDFETTDVTGTLHGTKVEILVEKPDPRFTSLIKPRIEFIDEMIASQDEI